MTTWFAVFLKILLFAIIPAILIFASRPEYYPELMQVAPFSYFGRHPVAQLGMFVIGTFLAALLGPVLLTRRDAELSTTRTQREALVELSSRTFQSHLRVVAHDTNLRMDIYVPDKGKGLWSQMGWHLCDFLEWLTKGSFKPVRYFVATDLSSNAGLRFQVLPLQDGPVGKAHQTCLPVSREIDEQLVIRAEKNRKRGIPTYITHDESAAGFPAEKVYHVTPEQFNKAVNWNNWICVPSCTENNVDLILSLYGTQPIGNSNTRKEIIELMAFFGDDLSRKAIKGKAFRSI